jgi:hypothetical protein
MFFGMCNSPATFQSVMDSIFAQEIEGDRIIVYMDDVLIFANELENLVKYERIVLQKLRDNDLYLKPKKCEFRKPKVLQINRGAARGGTFVTMPLFL